MVQLTMTQHVTWLDRARQLVPLPRPKKVPLPNPNNLLERAQ